MDTDTLLYVNAELQVPRTELVFRATRSGGPGGQHVNTSSTRVELWWDVAGSPSVSPDVRARLLVRLASRLDGEGRLRLVAQESRSQLRNREAAMERLRTVLADALKMRKARRKTKVPRGAKEQRLAEKRHRSTRKRERRPGAHDE
jgi:ribosome-associated protein